MILQSISLSIRVRVAAILLTTLVFLTPAANAQIPAPPGAGAPASVGTPAAAAPAAPFTLSVQKAGHGPALILIPGLYCSGDVWSETVARYKDRYTCYSLTLPGFGGQPPLKSDIPVGQSPLKPDDLGGQPPLQSGKPAGQPADTLLSRFADAIAGFIRQNGLQKPILVGHSLGGWLALKVAASYPGLLGGVVCVSSAPFLPALSMGNNVSLDSAKAIGLMIKGYMANATPEQTRQSQKFTLPTMMRDSARIAQVTNMAVVSDPATQGEVMSELFSIDLRPEMNKVQCPVLVLGDWISYKDYGATRENVLDKYQHQFAKAPHVTIVLSDTSKHFIMFDEPAWFFAQVDKFLPTL